MGSVVLGTSGRCDRKGHRPVIRLLLGLWNGLCFCLILGGCLATFL